MKNNPTVFKIHKTLSFRVHVFQYVKMCAINDLLMLNSTEFESINVVNKTWVGFNRCYSLFIGNNLNTLIDKDFETCNLMPVGMGNIN